MGRRRSRPAFDRLEDRQLLSLLDIASGALTYSGSIPSPAASNLTVATTGPTGTYSFTDTQAIFLSAGATSAGWTVAVVGPDYVATGPDSSVTSIAISQADGFTNTLTLSSVDAPTTVNYGNSSDTLNITSLGVAATASVTVAGPTAGGALTLGVDAGATAGTFATGATNTISYQAAGAGLISVAAPSATLGFTLSNEAANSLALDLNSLYTSPTPTVTTLAASSGNTQITLPTDAYSFPTANLASVTVGGTTDGGSLTVDYSGGDPLPASGMSYSPPVPTSPFVNSLTLQNGSFTSESYTASGAGAGAIMYNGTKSITFSNLSPIFDTVPSPTFTFTAPTGGGQTVDLVNGPVIGGTQTAQINDGGTGHFELVDFGNKTAVTLNTPGTGNTALVNYTTAAAGMTSLAVNGLAGNSATTSVQATPGGVPTTVTSSGGGTTTIGPILAAVLSNVGVSDLTGGGILNVSDAGDVTGQTFTITGTTVTTSATPAVFTYASSVSNLTVTGGSGNDTFNTNESGLVPADTYTVDGGPGFDTMNVTTTSPTVVVTTPGILTFGAGNAAINYLNLEQINITTPTAPPVGTAVPFTAVEAQQFTADRVATFTTTDLGTSASSFVASINWGDGSLTSGGAILANGTTSYDITGGHTYAVPGTYTADVTLTALGSTGSIVVGGTNITMTATGQALSTPNPIASTATVAAAPLSSSGVPVAGTQYLPLAATGGVLVATFTDAGTVQPTTGYTATIAWGDGSTSAATSITEQGTPLGVVFSVFGNHTYTTAGSVPVSVTIVKTSTGATTVAASTATIAPDSAMVAQGSPMSGLEGLPLSHASGSPVLVATFTDTSAIQPTTGYSATIAWGDGTSSAATSITEQGTSSGIVFSVFGDHTYALVGSYPVTVTILKAPLPGSTQPAPGSTAIASSTATVADAPLTGVTPAPTVSATEVTPFSGAVAQFTDLNPSATVAQFHATIDWGDGSPLSVGVITFSSGVFTVSGGHTYLQSLPQGTAGTGVPGPVNGTYGLKIYVVDTGGASLNLTNTAAVADVALTVTGQIDPSSNSSGIAVTPITNIAQPTFIGSASEVYAKIDLYAIAQTSTGPGPLVLVGQGQANNSGAWSVTTNTALTDGLYDFYAQGTDWAGQTYSALAFLGGATIDTKGPKITGMNFMRVQGQISYTIQDYGANANMGSGVVIASLMDANNYLFTKAHVERSDAYKVTSITVTPATLAGAQTVTLTINHGHYLRGGRYYITIKSLSDANTSGIRDLAGNALDGEFYNYFPSGNNVNGGNFVAELNAIHHIIYEPVSTVGTATPVYPPGTLGANTTIPTYNPPRTGARVAVQSSQSHALGSLDFLDSALHDLGSSKHKHK